MFLLGRQLHTVIQEPCFLLSCGSTRLQGLLYIAPVYRKKEKIMYVRLLWVHIIVPTLHCGLGHMAIPNCKGDWEMIKLRVQKENKMNLGEHIASTTP